MAVITKAFSEVDGTIAEASSINRVIDDLYTLQNGNIGGGNITDQGINGDKLDYTAILLGEVFL